MDGVSLNQILDVNDTIIGLVTAVDELEHALRKASWSSSRTACAAAWTLPRESGCDGVTQKTDVTIPLVPCSAALCRGLFSRKAAQVSPHGALEVFSFLVNRPDTLYALSGRSPIPAHRRTSRRPVSRHKRGSQSPAPSSRSAPRAAWSRQLVDVLNDAEYLLHQATETSPSTAHQAEASSRVCTSARGRWPASAAHRRTAFRRLPAALLQTRKALKHHLIVRGNGIRDRPFGYMHPSPDSAAPSDCANTRRPSGTCVRPNWMILYASILLMNWPQKRYLAAVRREKTGNAWSVVVLPGAVCADQRNDLALVHIK